MSALETIKAAFARQTKAAAAVFESIEGVRGQIIAQSNELHRLRAMPEPQAVAEVQLDREISAHVVTAQAMMARAIPSLSGIGRRSALPLDPTREEILALTIATNPKTFRALAVAELTAFYKDRDAMQRDQRDARIAEVEAELLKLELTEESMIRQAEAAGMDVRRRANANPAAVLAAIIEG
jgi:hypothetical protein